MADENKIGGKVELDITDFKTNIGALNREIKVIESGFKATAAGLGDWGASAEGLQAKIQSLTGVTEAQAKKVENLKELYKKVAAEKGADSKAAQDLEIKINNETAALNKNQRELTETTTALNNFGKETSDAEDKTSKLAESLKKISGGIAKGVAVGVAAIGAAAAGAAVGLFGMAQKASDYADGIQKASDVTGLSAEKVQELTYAGENLGVSFDTIAGANTKLIKNLDAAREGTGKQAEAFKSLGISVTDTNGNLRDSQTVFSEAVTKLGSVGNETERNALAMQLFGKSAMELNPLIKAGGDELARLTAEAQKNGVVLSGDQIAKLDAFGDSIGNLKLSFQGLGANISTAVLPALQGFIDNVQSITNAIGDAVKTGDWSQVGTAVAEGINGVLGQITKAFPQAVTVAVTVISGLANALLAAIPTILPVLIDAVIQLLNLLTKILQENGPKLLQAGIDALVKLIDGVVDALPKLIPMAITLILSLVEAIVDALPKLIPAAIDIVIALIDGIIAFLPKWAETAPKLMKTLIDAIIKNLPKLIEAAIKIVVALSKAIIDNLPIFISAWIQIIVAVAAALIENLPMILATIPKIFTGIYEAFKNLNLASIGVAIIDGIVSGVTKAAKNLANAVGTAAKNALAFVKSPSVLNINSPSKVFRDQVGLSIGEGMAEGITQSQKTVNRAMSGLSKQLVSGGEYTFNAKKNPSSIDSQASNTATQNEITVHMPVFLDGKVISNATSKIQFQNNLGRARALGVVPV